MTILPDFSNFKYKDMATTIIGIDLGGTNMRAGLVTNNKLKTVESAKVPKTTQWKEVFDQLVSVIEKVFRKEVNGIGIGVPGIVDNKTGMVFDIQNIPSWKKVPVAQLLSDHFGVPVYVNNDANCFAAGERFFGKGQEFDDFVGLITGTGLGAGIIKRGLLLPDQNCGAGEFGMIPYLSGNYENYCSGQFFEQHEGMNGKQVFDLAEKGDPKALKLLSDYGHHLGNAIKTIIFAVDPAAIILGGSVSDSYDYFKKSLFKELETFPYFGTIEKLNILRSEIPEIAILGAAALYYEKNKQK